MYSNSAAGDGGGSLQRMLPEAWRSMAQALVEEGAIPGAMSVRFEKV
jgi:hypothetical protein